MKNLFLFACFLLLLACSKAESPASLDNASKQAIAQTNASVIADLYAKKRSQVWVEDNGIVVKVLADDVNGARHQRFLVKVGTDQTLLFVHNIDLAARVENIKLGDHIAFSGEYIYNAKGGIIHWTHHDPQGKHKAGWIKLNGKIYE
ncbi:MAG: hypothetical protein RLZZ379_733 [Pseudomonadota bacterium]